MLATLRSHAILGVALTVAACGGRGHAPPQTWQPVLPEGRLQLVEANSYDVRYLALDDIARGEGAVRATVLVIGKTGTGIERKHAIAARRESINCADKTIYDETGGFYDAGARLVETRILTGAVGREAGLSDGEAAVACDAAAAGKGWVVRGWRAARRESQKPPADLKPATPEDADAHAWLCAAGARGYWTKATPGHCDKAIALLPKDAAPRLDRAFLHLQANRRGPAAADLRAALALEPDNPAGLFGRSLVAYLAGDKAGSKADRVRALDIDRRIADRLEAWYRLTIGPEFRARDR